MDPRHAENSHDRIADVLLDDAAMELDDLSGTIEIAAQHGPDDLWIIAVAKRCRADDVGEQDTYELALFSHPRSVRSATG
jgi:hypothetical protein